MLTKFVQLAEFSYRRKKKQWINYNV